MYFTRTIPPTSIEGIEGLWAANVHCSFAVSQWANVMRPWEAAKVSERTTMENAETQKSTATTMHRPQHVTTRGPFGPVKNLILEGGQLPVGMRAMGRSWSNLFGGGGGGGGEKLEMKGEKGEREGGLGRGVKLEIVCDKSSPNQLYWLTTLGLITTKQTKPRSIAPSTAQPPYLQI